MGIPKTEAEKKSKNKWDPPKKIPSQENSRPAAFVERALVDLLQSHPEALACRLGNDPPSLGFK